MNKKEKQNETQKNGAPPSASLVEVVFSFECPQAKKVLVCGEFNDWSPNSDTTMRKSGDGRWESRIPLPPGRYEYKFVVDGEWVADPLAVEQTTNCFGSANSVLEVRK
jgi:1,4-alpha-glucan branching enzyme